MVAWTNLLGKIVASTDFLADCGWERFWTGSAAQMGCDLDWGDDGPSSWGVEVVGTNLGRAVAARWPEIFPREYPLPVQILTVAESGEE